MMQRMMKTGVALGLSVLLTACATQDGGSNRAATGAIIGAVVGAVAGNQTDDRKKGRLVGATAGAIAGGLIGKAFDDQEKEFNSALAEEKANSQIQVERVREDLLKLTLDSEVSFDLNSAEIKPAFYGSLDKLAGVLVKYNRSNVTVVGHTDSSGSDIYNQELSLRRSRSVADYLSSRGVAQFRLRTEGRGESQPRASNDTASGRQLNRRVEVFVSPDGSA